MSSALNKSFFSKEVILYTTSGVVWTGGRQVKQYSCSKVLSFAEQLGLRIQRTGSSEVGEIRIYPEAEAVVEQEACPMDAMGKPEKALFTRGCSIVERFLDRDTADLARSSMGLDEVIEWVWRLTEMPGATEASLAVASMWLDDACPSESVPVSTVPTHIKFGCEHCGFMGVCDCEDELDFAIEAQADDDTQACIEYLVAEDDGPHVDEYQLAVAAASFITINPRDESVTVDGKAGWACNITRLIGVLKASDWVPMATNGYGVSRWYSPTRNVSESGFENRAAFAAQADAAAEPHKMVVILTPTGMFDFRDPDKPHARTYPKGWHIGRAYSWLVSRAWHVVEEDKYRGRIRHLTLSKLTHA